MIYFMRNGVRFRIHDYPGSERRLDVLNPMILSAELDLQALKATTPDQEVRRLERPRVHVVQTNFGEETIDIFPPGAPMPEQIVIEDRDKERRLRLVPVIEALDSSENQIGYIICDNGDFGGGYRLARPFNANISVTEYHRDAAKFPSGERGVIDQGGIVAPQSQVVLHKPEWDGQVGFRRVIELDPAGVDFADRWDSQTSTTDAPPKETFIGDDGTEVGRTVLPTWNYTKQSIQSGIEFPNGTRIFETRESYNRTVVDSIGHPFSYYWSHIQNVGQNMEMQGVYSHIIDERQHGMFFGREQVYNAWETNYGAHTGWVWQTWTYIGDTTEWYAALDEKDYFAVAIPSGSVAYYTKAQYFNVRNSANWPAFIFSFSAAITNSAPHEYIVVMGIVEESGARVTTFGPYNTNFPLMEFQIGNQMVYARHYKIRLALEEADVVAEDGDQIVREPGE